MTYRDLFTVRDLGAMTYADLFTVRDHRRAKKDCQCSLCARARADIKHDQRVTGGRFARLWLQVIMDDSDLRAAGRPE